MLEYGDESVIPKIFQIINGTLQYINKNLRYFKKNYGIDLSKWHSNNAYVDFNYYKELFEKLHESALASYSMFEETSSPAFTYAPSPEIIEYSSPEETLEPLNISNLFETAEPAQLESLI